MESLPVRRKSCLLRIRENCPFRKLRRQTYDVSAATCSSIGSYWNSICRPTTNQPFSSAYVESRPHLCQIRSDQSQLAADVQMEEEPPAAKNRRDPQNQEDRAHDCMDLDYIDPETGERAQG